MTKSVQTIAITRLEKELNINREDARSVQAAMILVMNSYLDVPKGLLIIDTILRTCGIEYLPHKHDEIMHFYGVDYCNTGDSYATTVCYNYRTKTFQLKSYADYVEQGCYC